MLRRISDRPAGFPKIASLTQPCLGSNRIPSELTNSDGLRLPSGL